MKDMFLATRQKSRDQIVSCSLVSDEKFVLAIMASSKFKIKVKLTSRFSGPTTYPCTLYRWGTFSCFYGHDPSQIYAMTGENVVLAERPASNIVLTDELLICYTNYIPKSPRILLKVSSGSALNSSSDSLCNSIFLSPLADSPFIEGG